MKYEVKIPKPCHEDWSKMSPTEKGKFCLACKKEVVDFTRMTDEQILTHLNERKGDAVCGRLRKEQLDKEVGAKEGFQVSKVAAAIALTAVLAGSEPLFAQGQVMKIGKVEHVQGQNVPNINRMMLHGEKIIIKGKVIESVSLESLPKAKVFVNGTQHKTEVDKEGNFTLSYEKNGFDKDTLIVWYLGYKPAQIPIFSDEPLKIELEPDAVILDNPKMEEARTKKNKHILDQVIKLFGLKSSTIKRKNDKEE